MEIPQALFLHRQKFCLPIFWKAFRKHFRRLSAKNLIRRFYFLLWKFEVFLSYKVCAQSGNKPKELRLRNHIDFVVKTLDFDKSGAFCGWFVWVIHRNSNWHIRLASHVALCIDLKLINFINLSTQLYSLKNSLKLFTHENSEIKTVTLRMTDTSGIVNL